MSGIASIDAPPESLLKAGFRRRDEAAWRLDELRGATSKSRGLGFCYWRNNWRTHLVAATITLELRGFLWIQMRLPKPCALVRFRSGASH
jgi:hypothetical protein